jgi:hypothetical protein
MPRCVVHDLRHSMAELKWRIDKLRREAINAGAGQQ